MQKDVRQSGFAPAPLLSGDLRRLFIDYFSGKGHRIVQSSSIIPAGDDSIMFTNAGMVQFKDYFTGVSSPAFQRAVTVQKCLRAGGKHNDLENVGKTSRHHTFFEMLGNFSFGDYFKKEAVIFAYDFLKNVLKLKEERLYVSVHEKDEEGFFIWKDAVKFDRNKIFRLGDDSNFWQMGETGPCGYSSEIFFDTGYSEQGHETCDIMCDCGRHLEIWNLVFMEFDRDKSGRLSRLPKPSIDTGMGLERILRVLQNVKSNYDTDVFMPYINAINSITERRYDAGDENYDTAARVISDHIRASVFLSADSVFPSNEGRGYVFRRILRRLIRYSLKIGLSLENLIHLGNMVVIVMGDFYPEASDGAAFFEKIIKEEYERFNDTVGIGLRLLDDEIAVLKANREKTIPGDFIFRLYDTNGLPVDLAGDVASESGLAIDMDRFRELMEIQRKSSKQKKEKFNILDIPTLFTKTVFTGYDTLEGEENITAVLGESGDVVREIKNEEGNYYIIAPSSPFYPEGGGQAGDRGVIEWKDGSMRVLNTVKTKNGAILHWGRIFGNLKGNERALFLVDGDLRNKTASNHSATHLLQTALRTVLGPHISQQGSYVDSERLRFDFSHLKPVLDEELRKVEYLVNSYIFSNLSVTVKEMAASEALGSGALHFFDEKYEDTVRVVSMGDISKEFCGGTHVRFTGEIGFFKIISESSVASGIRRIEGVTGYNYLSRLYMEEDNLRNIASLLGAPESDIYNRIIKLYYDYELLEKENEELREKLNNLESDALVKNFRKKGNIDYLVSTFRGLSADELKDLMNALKSSKDFPSGSSLVVFVSLVGEEKLVYVVMGGGEADASKTIKLLNSRLDGKGGGRKDFAQGGSLNILIFDSVKSIVEEIIASNDV